MSCKQVELEGEKMKERPRKQFLCSEEWETEVIILVVVVCV